MKDDNTKTGIGERLFAEIGNLDEKLVEEAAGATHYFHRKRTLILRRATASAAALAAALGLFVFVNPGFFGKKAESARDVRMESAADTDTSMGTEAAMGPGEGTPAALSDVALCEMTTDAGGSGLDEEEAGLEETDVERLLGQFPQLEEYYTIALLPVEESASAYREDDTTAEEACVCQYSLTEKETGIAITLSLRQTAADGQNMAYASEYVEVLSGAKKEDNGYSMDLILDGGHYTLYISGEENAEALTTLAEILSAQ